MTKRYGQFDQKNNKKIKLEDDIEALWGDDIDDDVLENCIQHATQIYEQEKISSTQLNNGSILPTYSAFNQQNVLFSSTQLTQLNSKPSTSKHKYEFVPKKPIIAGNLENDIRILQQQYQEKEGEVSILRVQLQETKTNLKAEQHKLQNDWKEKLTQSEKEMKSVKAELEFKDLEIVNLKQRILEITKHNVLNTTENVLSNIVPKVMKEKHIVEKTNTTQSNILQPILDRSFPLKGIKSEVIFNIAKEEHCIMLTNVTSTCRNAIPFLQNQSVSANVATERSDVSIDCVYADVLTLICCTESELNDKECFVHINKLVCTCEQFMYDLQIFLKKIKDNLRTEDVLEADSTYLKNQDCILDSQKGNEMDEIGIKSGVLLNLLAELLPYSEYLQKYICRDNPLVFSKKENYRNEFPYQMVKEQTTSLYFLSAILNIVRISGEIRKTICMSNFLCSTIKLLINIHKSRNYNYVSDIFCKLTKEIILSRPSAEIIYRITFLFKVASQHSSFVEYLLNKSKNSITSKKGIIYFNKDACRFYIFVLLFDNTINTMSLRNETFPLKVYLNLLCFMYNTFKNSHWIHHQNTKECECVSQLYKLEIEIVSRALERFIEETNQKKLLSSEWAHFFKNPITAKILNLMAFNSYELIEKYIMAFSQYQQIEKKLQEDDDVIELEKLNITDEVVEIPSSAFANVDF